MKNICVITGGGSGMGLAAAKILGKDNYIIIAGRTVKKLESAVTELRAAGIEAEAAPCDVSDRASATALAERAAAKGAVAITVHAAGMSPHMGDPQTLLKVNALGTVYINNAFFGVMGKGARLIDISSVAGYMYSPTETDLETYKLSLSDPELFLEKLTAQVNEIPENQRRGAAYTIAKNFVTWRAKADAARFGEKGARILSISPGLFETPMGDLEKENASYIIPRCAMKRMGKVEEIAELIAFCASEKPGYLTGTDILCDGGYIASRV